VFRTLNENDYNIIHSRPLACVREKHRQASERDFGHNKSELKRKYSLHVTCLGVPQRGGCKAFSTPQSDKGKKLYDLHKL
jgi:hypothetical protein